MAISLNLVTTIQAMVGEPIPVGETPRGYCMIVPISGGRFQGPRLSGQILVTGSDWNCYRPHEETMEFWARYDLRTDDGIVISIINEGVGHATPNVLQKLAAAEPLGTGTWSIKTRPRFEAPIESAYSWMNRATFVAEVPYPKNPKLAVIPVYEVVGV